MSSDTSSMPDIEEYMASICNENEVADKRVNATASCDDDCSSSEVEIIRELKVNLEKHECALCCEGTFLVNKLLQFGGVLNDEHKHACDICNTGFKTKADVRNHKRLHEDGGLLNDSGIQDATSLLHIPNSHEIGTSMPSSSKKKNSAPVVCNICYKILKSERTLETHKRNMHSNVIYTCEICDIKFSKFRVFKKHCAIHTGSEELFICPTCNKKFSYKGSFKNHVCSLKT